ncbi:hypothetical protein [Caldivirga maquilingensis]|uniref:Uncharacterized protein n=1 Tax=Caldivirga maquilingensis (strain ATCC 700844 / DSM 13496 / JCM 10307 / IC-167) TaxID=397948 RepID=A8MD15_CALMQ|nr:hypothetical protein [Caldivirga maquilingensis]ABW01671.1 hypothetical protein Cmaq_0836 [Caldivirga maquilingensis IC-167]
MVSVQDVVEESPVADVHNHLNPRSLSPSGFQDVLLYHYIVTELRSAGAPLGFGEVKGFDELKPIIPYFRRIRNTATHWGLMRILNDLYGLRVSGINEGNVNDVVKAIESVKGDEDRAVKVIRDSSRVRKSVLTLNPLEPLPEYDESLFTGALRLDPLLPDINPQSINKLSETYGISINNPNDIDEALSSIIS